MKTIEDEDWNKVLAVVEILEPFKKATEEICGDNYVISSQLYCVFTILKDHLVEVDKKDKYNLFKKIIIDMAAKYDSYWDIIKPFAIISNGLDPRFKIDVMSREDKKYFSNTLNDLFENNTEINCQKNESSSQEENKISLSEKLLLKKKILANSSNEIENYLSSPRCSL